MTDFFPATRQELERWRDEGLVLPVWWRDDDAVEPTKALERLLTLAQNLEAPLHLAIVPASASLELAARLKECVHVFALVHGWSHANHAPEDQKKAEFGPHRPLPAMMDDIAASRSRMDSLFGAQALPVFTPPWNRISPEVVAGLHGLGFEVLSTYLPRSAEFAAPGLRQVNTHLDPVAWKNGGGLIDKAALDSRMAQALNDRRNGDTDNREPYGLLTHHLVQDEATWSFTERFLGMVATSGVARWTSPRTDAPK